MDGPRDVNSVPATERDLPLGANRAVTLVRYIDQTAEMDYKDPRCLTSMVADVDSAERRDAGALATDGSGPIIMEEYIPDKQVDDENLPIYVQNGHPFGMAVPACCPSFSACYRG